jgi:hypothetical protein
MLRRNLVRRDVIGRKKEITREEAKENVVKRLVQAEVDLGAMQDVAHFIAINEYGEENLRELVVEVETLLLGGLI